MHTELTRDKQVIRAIRGVHRDHFNFEVGQAGVTLIDAYDECGSMSNVPWIAVYVGEKIICRLPADAVAIYFL